MNATFVRRALVALLVLVVVSLLALAAAFFQFRSAHLQLNDAEKRLDTSFRLTLEFRQSLTDMTRLAREFVVTRKADYRRQYFKMLDVRDGRSPRPEEYHRVYWELIDPENPTKPRPDSADIIPMRELFHQQLDLNEEEKGLLETAENLSQKLSEVEIQAINARRGRFLDKFGNYGRLDVPDEQMAMNLIYGTEYLQQKMKVSAAADAFFAALEKRVEGEADAAAKSEDLAQMEFVGVMVVALLLIGGLIYFARKQSQMELAERTAAQKKAEQENEQLNDSVINILQAVNSLSQRDLTVRAPVTTDLIGTVSDSINALTDETAKVLLGVHDIADEVSGMSHNVKTQAEKVAQTAEDERQSVQKMLESLLDATQATNRVAALAEQSNQAAEQATSVTDNALGTVNETVKGMESIRETIAETEKRIKRLGERSQEITGIVNLINTISERTHVLALNASMQAAVAGEAGRGFAVVAEEVQRLAESSRNATQQIGALVNNIQLETNETINTVNQTIGQVVQGSEQAQKAGEQMRRTQEITALLVSQVRRIAEASEQQKEMSAHLLEAVQYIGESTEQTARQIEEQNKETASLQQAAERLVESVNVFKLPMATAAAAT